MFLVEMSEMSLQIFLKGTFTRFYLKLFAIFQRSLLSTLQISIPLIRIGFKRNYDVRK